MLGLYFIRKLKARNIKRRDDIEKSAKILYENVMFCRNPILVLVLLTEISIGD